MLSELGQLLTHQLGILPNELIDVLPLFQIERVSKKDFLVNENSVSTDFYFIVEGYLRSFHTTYEGEEITTELFSKGEVAASMYSLLQREKAFESVQCITDSIVAKISEASFEQLCNQHPKWFKLGMRLLKEMLLKKEERVRMLSQLSAQDRYKKLLSTRADLIRNVPISQIASYLGIQPESLSRIRGQFF